MNLWLLGFVLVCLVNRRIQC